MSTWDKGEEERKPLLLALANEEFFIAQKLPGASYLPTWSINGISGSVLPSPLWAWQRPPVEPAIRHVEKKMGSEQKWSEESLSHLRASCATVLRLTHWPRTGCFSWWFLGPSSIKILSKDPVSLHFTGEKTEGQANFLRAEQWACDRVGAVSHHPAHQSRVPASPPCKKGRKCKEDPENSTEGWGEEWLGG